MSCFTWVEESATRGKRTKISTDNSIAAAHNNLGSPSNAWDVDAGLAADFDGSLSGLGSELGADTYNMSEALLALPDPVFKQESLENGFQYVLGAATSPAVKINEETLTYLNQGQSYELSLKKLGDLSDLQGKVLRTVIKILFHGRRMQYMEREQLDNWCFARPGERFLDIDVPLSYGIVDARLDPNRTNVAEFIWDPTKETSVYIKVNGISTEFTAKKHGGEKGVPFRVHAETYTHGDGESKLLHCASCQVKVFKPKGADRKHKTDREKMEKRTGAEKEKFQPSYECTVLSEIPIDNRISGSPGPAVSATGSVSTSIAYAASAAIAASAYSPAALSIGCSQSSPSSVITTPNSSIRLHNNTEHLSPSPVVNAVKDTPNSPERELVPLTLCSSPTKDLGSLSVSDIEPLSVNASAGDVTRWLHFNRFSNYVRIFQNFSGADLFRLSRDDLTQICGVADGIRLNNALLSRACRPKLTVYVCHESGGAYIAVYLDKLTAKELLSKLVHLYQVQEQAISDLYCQGPSGIHVIVTDEFVQNMQDHSKYCLEAGKDDLADTYRILLKSTD